MTKPVTAKQLTDFLVACIDEAEADGYQQSGDNDPEFVAPDSWGYDHETSLRFRFGDQNFSVFVQEIKP